MATFKAMNKEQIVSAINSIQKNGKKLDNDIQKAALSIVQHVNQFHEVSLVNRLIEAMPKGSRVNALREWMMKHAKVTFNEAEQVFEPSREEPKNFDLALAEHWTSCKPEPKFRPINLQEEVNKLVKRAMTAANSENASKHNISEDLLEKLLDLAVIEEN